MARERWPLAEAALDYAGGRVFCHLVGGQVFGLAVAVLPVWWPRDGGCGCPAGHECPSPGKHPVPRNGVYGATTNQRQLAAWWRRYPHANIGLATGRDLVGLDLDGIGAVDEWGRLLSRERSCEPRTPVAR